MANWSEGVLRVHGRNKDLINFMKNGIREIIRVDMQLQLKEPKVKVTDYEVYLHSNNDLYIEGSCRMFSEDTEISLYWDGEPEEENTLAFNIKQAWAVSSENLKTLSRKYKIDFRITTYEKGMEFSQEIEVISGKITKDTQRNFDDYLWECENPLMGG